MRAKRKISSGPRPSRSKRKRRRRSSKERKLRLSASANARRRSDWTLITPSRNLSVEVVAVAGADEVDVEANVANSEDAVVVAVEMGSVVTVKVVSVVTVKVALEVREDSAAVEDVAVSVVNSEVVVEESSEDAVDVDAAVLRAALRSPSLIIRLSPVLDPHERHRCLNTTHQRPLIARLNSPSTSHSRPQKAHTTPEIRTRTIDQSCSLASSLDGMASQSYGN
jgi:hypothetical protein